MKLREATVKIFEDASAAALETAVNTFLKGAGEAQLISIQYSGDASTHTCCVIYTQS